MTAQVFISHARQDARAAQTICNALEQRGFGCWIAARDVEAGENFQVSIVRAIRAAKVLILVFSANANNSDEIKKEVVLAGQNRLVVIPVRIEDVIPDEGLAYELATRQWIDFFEDRETALHRLVRRLEAIAGVTREDPTAAPAPSAPSFTEATRGSPLAFRVAKGSAETRASLQFPPVIANHWRAWVIGLGIIGVVIAAIAAGVDSLATRQSPQTLDQPQTSGAAPGSGKAPVMNAPALELAPPAGKLPSAYGNPGK